MTTTEPVTREERLWLAAAILMNCPHVAELRCQFFDEGPPCCYDAGLLLARQSWLVFARRQARTERG